MKILRLDDVIRRRKSVRMYDQREVNESLLKEIVASARFAPSACNAQPWRFVVVTDREKVRLIFEESLGGIVSNRWARTAPVYIVACMRKSLLIHKVGAGLKGIPYHFLDMGAAIEHVLLKATELGLGTCWIGWFNKRAVRKILSIPKDVYVVSLITIGYEFQESQEKRKEKRELNEILFLNQFGKPFK